MEINLNPRLADILKHHEVGVGNIGEFIITDLPDQVKFKARAVYQEINHNISSRLEVMVLTGRREKIVGSYGDFGATIEEAVYNNLRNFSASSLHPLLAAFGCNDPHTYKQIVMEEWEINGKSWKAYIGNLTPKILADEQSIIAPPSEFFDSFERGIKAQQLTNRLHWFRGYYSQFDDKITDREFLMDNEPPAGAEAVFKALPILPDTRFYSCRNFIILKNTAAD
ncbi:MAG: hypothetical protein INR73_00425 [Williamsia sp.]|nr:hypothetical protein [Williamsia sp.]